MLTNAIPPRVQDYVAEMVASIEPDSYLRAEIIRLINIAVDAALIAEAEGVVERLEPRFCASARDLDDDLDATYRGE